MKKYLPVLLLLIATVATATLQAATPQTATLADFEASYVLKRGSLYIGNSTASLQTEPDGSYLYKTHSWPVRWISWFLKDQLRESSRGKITADGLRPARYHYQLTGGKREREDDLVFDRENNTVKNLVADDSWEIEVPPDTIDQLSTQLGMILALQQGKKDVTFNIADDEKVKQYRLKVVGDETLEVPAGTFETVKVTRLRDSNKRETSIWFAPALDYLPVRIRHRESDDSVYTSDLENFSGDLRVKRK